MTGTLLDIPRLTCAYHGGQPVFSLKDLRFQRGELVFLLGRSGIGKSTFLELAGLMNLPGGGTEGEIRFQAADGTSTSLLQLWHEDGSRIADFRSAHLSFIFQGTNFLEHFTAGENMILPALVQGMTESEARSRVVGLMRELDLPDALYDRYPVHVSGGQRQRMAFIRALAGSFDILFGDEPTGNLDAATAGRLLEVLRNHLHDEGRTGIIVSHDIGLAVRFADRILVFTAESDDESGSTLLPEHRFQRNKNGQWQREDGTNAPPSMADHLAALIRSETAQAMAS